MASRPAGEHEVRGHPARHDIAVLTHPENRGYGAALLSAFRYAIDRQYEILVTIDCDGRGTPIPDPSISSRDQGPCGHTYTELGDIGPGRSVFVFANIVWLEDEDQIPPVRMAAVFAYFARAGDQERLLKQFATGRYRMAA